ncbi:Uncharacterised protein [Legionella busanensis]|uniref:Uncharacterized protein n=1 Tax=Legionella busanensis TaxID=190655 RepID=A0A378JKT6_9GAMM|nr:hypothetical protein [Legionella busanensis]STX51804.1 Uncharacterised protein [Legionella busanensis]
MINPKFINLNQIDLSSNEIKKLTGFFDFHNQSDDTIWQANTQYTYGENNDLKMQFNFQIIKRTNKKSRPCRYDIFGTEGVRISDSQIVYPMLGSFILTKDNKLHYIPNLHDEVIIAMPTSSTNLEKPFGDTFQNLRSLHPYYSEISFAATDPILDSARQTSYTVVRQIYGEKFTKIISEKNGAYPLSLEERFQITLALLKALKEINPQDYNLKEFKWDHVLIERHRPVKVDITYALPKKSKPTKSESKQQESSFIKDTAKHIYSLWSDLSPENLESSIKLDTLKDFDHLTHDGKKLVASAIESMLGKNASFKDLKQSTTKFKEAQAKTAITSEKIHNKNCYSYLRELKEMIPDFLGKDFEGIKKELEAIKKHQSYQNEYSYAKLYTQLITFLDHNIGFISINLKEEDREKLNKFIDVLYNNDSHLLEQTYAAIRHIPHGHRPSKSSKGIEHTIADALSEPFFLKRINAKTASPADNETWHARLSAVVGNTFTPQYYTNIPSIRSYPYKEKKGIEVRELRIGTQAQRYKGQTRVSPLFEYWLKNQLGKQPSQSVSTEKSPITHIYFNNLARDREIFDREKFTFDFLGEGNKEKALTAQLENLEKGHSNLAVITLPADKGFMARGDYLKTKEELKYQTVFDTFLSIARGVDTLEPKIKDFYISPKIRGLLFNFGGHPSSEYERKVLQDLLTNSFKAMGIVNNDGNLIPADRKLSQAERQAVWFHFIKFELTNFIIDRLKPASINFSCKDAIDRGGASSAYFNLMKSIEAGHPLSREEFEQALHAAATSVKGRGMNHHLNIIWNAIDQYVNSQQYKDKLQEEKEKLKKHPELQSQLEWLIQWRDFNCPHGRVTKLLERRIAEVTEELEQEEKNRPDLFLKINQSLKIVETIKFHYDKKVSGKRLLLEAISLTPAITLKSDNKSLIQYDKLADELRITHPKLQVLAGLMKAAIGIILFVFSFSKHTNTLKQGAATFRAGYHTNKREALVDTMKDHVTLAKQLNMKEFDANLRLIPKEKEEQEGESGSTITQENFSINNK